MKKIFSLLTCSLLLNCAYAEQVTNKQKGLDDIATSPLKDLNLSRKEIPIILERAKKHPYLIEKESTCESLNEEVKTLNEVLGQDIDVEVEKDSNSEVVTQTAMNTLGNTVSGLIPYRGWLRKLSGAESHERKMNECINAGLVRRAFLKGYMAGKICEIENIKEIEPLNKLNKNKGE